MPSLAALAGLALLPCRPALSQEPPKEKIVIERPAKSTPTVGPELPPFRQEASPWDLPSLEQTPKTGVWPIDKLRELAEDQFGKKKVDGAIEKGLKSLERNIYRKYYIEGGYFLVPLPDPFQSGVLRDTNEPAFWVPEDPKSDPRVIFMKDIHRLEEHGEGLSNEIRRALASGDKDLVALAGRSLFDSKFSRTEWSFDLNEKKFGDDWYFYKIRQKRLTQLKAEVGVGDSWQLGGAPYYVGGALSADGELKANLKGFFPDADPRAKLGFWGKVPFVDRTSFGLSALQGYHAEGDGSSFTTEFRFGLFSASRSGQTFGALAHRTYSGADVFSKDSVSTGGQLFWSPVDFLTTFLSYERSSADSEKGKHYFLAGVDLVVEQRRTDLGALAAGLLGFEPGGTTDHRENQERLRRVETLFALASRALSIALDDKAPEFDARRVEERLLQTFRSSLAAERSELVLRLGGGRDVKASASQVLEWASSVECQRFRDSKGEAPVPGWGGFWPRPAAEVAREVLSRLPPDQRPDGPLSPAQNEALVDLVRIHASLLRRDIDVQVAKSYLLLAAVAKLVERETRLDVANAPEGAPVLVARLQRMGRKPLLQLPSKLALAAAWLQQEYANEGVQLQESLARHGGGRLESFTKAPGWPSNLRIAGPRDADWGPILAGWGDALPFVVLAPAIERAVRTGRPMKLALGWTPVGNSPRARKLGADSYYLELAAPRPGATTEELATQLLDLAEQAFKD